MQSPSSVLKVKRYILLTLFHDLMHFVNPEFFDRPHILEEKPTLYSVLFSLNFIEE